MKSIKAATYYVHFNHKGYEELNSLLIKKDYSSIFILVDENSLELCYPVFIPLLETDKRIEIIEIESGEINKNLDTSITNQELEDVYSSNKQLFVLKEDLLKMRYLNINTKLSNLEEVKKRFKRFNEEDKKRLDSISIQFNSFYLKDSIWIKSEQAISKIKPLQLGFNKVLLKKPNFIQLKDSLGLYLMQINEVLERGNQAPIEYVLPTLKQIIINNRKLKLIKQLKSDIVNDAIKNKKFEIYN